MKRFKKYIVYIGVVVAILSLLLSSGDIKDSVLELYPQLTPEISPSLNSNDSKLTSQLKRQGKYWFDLLYGGKR